MASFVYNQFKGLIMEGVMDLESDVSVFCALMGSAHSASTNDDDGWANVSTNEITGTGYSAGGRAFTSVSVSVDDTNNEGVFDAEDAVWTTATFTAYYAVIYDGQPTTPVADPLICSIDFGGAQQVTSGTFTIQWHADGIINIG